MNDVLSVILGGGRGSRLFPLTVQRSKPAVPIAGKYRLIDIPISNCLNSGLRRMFVLTQFNSESLNKHISLTYKFDLFSSAFVSILAAEQTEEDPDWYQGTADAVRQSLRHLETHRWKEALILSGDQLYQMDYRKLMESHRRQVADVTVAVTPVTADQAHAFGILKVNKQGRIVHFDEKPPRERLDGLVSEVPGLGQTFLASMGIYMFGRDLLVRTVSDPKLVDFGRHIIPKLVPEARVHAYVYRGYWEDVGTIRSYYEANLALCQPVPPFDFYDTSRPVFSNPRFLPATKIEGCTIENALVAEGSIIGQPDPGGRLLRDGRGGAACGGGGPPAHRDRRRDGHPARDHRQERAHRARSAHRQRGGRPGEGRPRVLHPRRSRDRSQERGHTGWHGDLTRPGGRPPDVRGPRTSSPPS